MRITRRQIRRVIWEAMEQVPRWPEQHFAWRNTAFTKDDDVRYILDVADPETVQASVEMGEPVPPGTNVLIVKGVYPNTEKVWLYDAELLDLIEREGWHERPPPPGAKSGFWDGKGEWSEDPEPGSYDLPPEVDLPRADESRLRKIIKEAIDQNIQFEWSRDGLSMIMLVDGQKAADFSTQKEVQGLIMQLEDLLAGPMRTSP